MELPPVLPHASGVTVPPAQNVNVTQAASKPPPPAPPRPTTWSGPSQELPVDLKRFIESQDQVNRQMEQRFNKEMEAMQSKLLELESEKDSLRQTSMDSLQKLVESNRQ